MTPKKNLIIQSLNKPYMDQYIIIQSKCPLKNLLENSVKMYINNIRLWLSNYTNLKQLTAWCHSQYGCNTYPNVNTSKLTDSKVCQSLHIIRFTNITGNAYHFCMRERRSNCSGNSFFQVFLKLSDGCLHRLRAAFTKCVSGSTDVSNL